MPDIKKPSPDDIKASLSDMDHDAMVWHELSGGMTKLAVHIDGLNVTAISAGIFIGLHGTYTALVEHMSSLASSGAKRFADISQTLKTTEKMYHDMDMKIHGDHTKVSSLIDQNPLGMSA